MAQRRGMQQGTFPPEIRWTLGCLVAAAALVGALILMMLVAMALAPPTWVQVVLGVLLAAGGAALAWLVASALAQRGARDGGGQRDPGAGGVADGP